MHGRIENRVNSGYITIITSDQHNIPAFWAHPEAGGNRPGLVLIHEWWGLTPHIRATVRRFAEMGFYTIAPDLYNGAVAQTSHQAYAMWQQTGDSKLLHIDAALRALETHNRFNGKMGIVGFQAGGELAYDAILTRSDLACGVIFYARPDDYLNRLPNNKTPLLTFYGYSDTSANLHTLILLRDALTNSPAHGEVVIYSGATIGFFNDEMPTYHPKAAADAWGKTLDFLAKNLTIDSNANHADTPDQAATT
jgi:carboxymethylenebutenolidase